MRHRTDSIRRGHYSARKNELRLRKGGVGLATLNVWVRDKRDPCKISDDFWFVAVTYCNGNPVEWCGHTYGGEGAKCGHAEFQLPPGCYVIRGFQWIVKPFPLFYFSDHAIVVVGCDQVACVHLYTPTSRQSSHGAAMAVQFSAESERLAADKVEKFGVASDALRKDKPETAVDSAHDGSEQHLADFLCKNPPK